MDREQLAHFLRTRREALQPEDVGLPRRPRRRTSGLSRDEVAVLVGMSTDYYSRLEQQRGPKPSEQMLAAIAQGLRLSLDERDHLFRLAGHSAPTRVLRSDHVSQGLMRVLDRLTDTPALVLSDLGETLVQNWLATALLGDQTHFTGLARSSVYRWFTDPSSRAIYPEADHDHHARVQVATLRAALVRNGPGSRARALVDSLLELSPEFTALWEQHEVAVRRGEHKRVVHPELGVLDLHCQVLRTDSQDQILLVYTASPGTEGYEKLTLLSVLGSTAS
ncbi:helix-turn-helix transcriptional regulator [Allokutzneria albata]|uniref:Helix-turn-helix domain-containing protein n=1 Tax=Allokutzneria albata TaxID=211114 RepID=A0A1G9U2X0_ALLAB|nr:helix-turn-helix transcriptional regulator [Allokutzneria albata]SDM54337.1 Helix-turn-helix domain-containing protein [Allokutzneria albata]